ncbi:MAG: hypothetical protein QOD73_1708 [Solirubrobacteraceae bacterium]|nr:hypothetical protein [Solirubrobacteraceae bacterium]
MRPSMRDVEAAKKVVRQEAMDRAIEEGRLVVRTMTDAEREESTARVAAAARAGRPRRAKRTRG